MEFKSNTVEVLEQCQVAPPPQSVPPKSLPLTFFDVMWLELPPVQRILFYCFPGAITATDLLPRLKHALSLALQIFYPLAGHLTHNMETGQYEIRFTDGDSVQLTIVKCDSDFNHLVSYCPRELSDFQGLAPRLSDSHLIPSPVLALQLTLFPNSGFSISYSMKHAAADGSTISHFLRSWALICRTGDLSSIDRFPVFDRTYTSTLNWITTNYFREMEEIKFDESLKSVDVKTQPNKVRAIFVLTHADIDRLKSWAITLRGETSKGNFRFSSFVMACAYTWVCLVVARGSAQEVKMAHLVFPVDCRNRLHPPLPQEYFGNCLSTCFVQAKVNELSQRDGVVVAAESIQRAIRGLEGEGLLRGAERWTCRVAELASQRAITVAGSPRLRVYDTDFGWGRPVKLEILSIDGTGAIGLNESKDEEGGFEIGLALTQVEMDGFDYRFKEGLKRLS